MAFSGGTRLPAWTQTGSRAPSTASGARATTDRRDAAAPCRPPFPDRHSPLDPRSDDDRRSLLAAVLECAGALPGAAPTLPFVPAAPETFRGRGALDWLAGLPCSARSAIARAAGPDASLLQDVASVPLGLLRRIQAPADVAALAAWLPLVSDPGRTTLLMWPQLRYAALPALLATPPAALSRATTLPELADAVARGGLAPDALPPRRRTARPARGEAEAEGDSAGGPEGPAPWAEPLASQAEPTLAPSRARPPAGAMRRSRGAAGGSPSLGHPGTRAPEEGPGTPRGKRRGERRSVEGAAASRSAGGGDGPGGLLMLLDAVEISGGGAAAAATEGAEEDGAGDPGTPRKRRRWKGELVGPCSHCGARESPQWRKGPPCKPALCNACGTRWLRFGTVERSARGSPVVEGLGRCGLCGSAQCGGVARQEGSPWGLTRSLGTQWAGERETCSRGVQVGWGAGDAGAAEPATANAGTQTGAASSRQHAGVRGSPTLLRRSAPAAGGLLAGAWGAAPSIQLFVGPKAGTATESLSGASGGSTLSRSLSPEDPGDVGHAPHPQRGVMRC